MISAAERISPMWAGSASVFQGMLLNLEDYETGICGTGIGRDGNMSVFQGMLLDLVGSRFQDSRLGMH